MNASQLNRSLGALTPGERLSAPFSAHARGDESEHRRLYQSAPRHNYSLPDHYGLADAWLHVSLVTLVDVLAKAVAATVICGVEAVRDRGSKRAAGEQAMTADKLHRLAADYLAKLESWRRFAAEHGLDGRVLWIGLPVEVVDHVEDLARSLGVEVTAESVEKELQGLRELLDAPYGLAP